MPVGDGGSVDRSRQELTIRLSDARLTDGIEVDRRPGRSRHVGDSKDRKPVRAVVDVNDVMSVGEREGSESLARGSARLALIIQRGAGQRDRRVIRDTVVVVSDTGVIDRKRRVVVDRDVRACERGVMIKLQSTAADDGGAGVGQRAQHGERAAGRLDERKGAAAAVLDEACVGDAAAVLAHDQRHG